MAQPRDTDQSSGEYEVAVAITPMFDERRESPIPRDGTEDVAPGFDPTVGSRSQGRRARDFLLEKGDEAVRVATESIARQIGLAAQRIVIAIDEQAGTPILSSSLSLESVEVSFGLTLLAGVEALFTAMTESSAQVTIVLSRRPPDDSTNKT